MRWQWYALILACGTFVTGFFLWRRKAPLPVDKVILACPEEPTILECPKRHELHFYWNGPLNGACLLSLRSALRTQQCTNINLWLDSDTTRDEFISQLPLQNWKDCTALTTLQFRSLDELQSLQTKAGLPDCLAGLDSAEPATSSQLIRFLILYLCGGIFSDLDVVFLRPLAPFHGENFVYMDGYRDYPSAAVMGMQQGSGVFPQLIRNAGGCNTTTFNVSRLFHTLGCPDTPCPLKAFPTSLFDPLAGLGECHSMATGRPGTERFYFVVEEDGYDSLWDRPLMSGAAIADVFPGAFALHFHGRWERPAQDGSVMSLWQQLNAACPADHRAPRRRLLLDLAAGPGEVFAQLNHTFLYPEGEPAATVEAYLVEANLANLEQLLAARPSLAVNVIPAVPWHRDELLESASTGGVLALDVGRLAQSILQPRLEDYLLLSVDLERVGAAVWARLSEVGLLALADRVVLRWSRTAAPAEQHRLEASLAAAGLHFQYQTLGSAAEQYGPGQCPPAGRCASHYAALGRLSGPSGAPAP